jgi:hypothetical protein
MMENRVHTSSGLTVYAQSARAVGGRAEEAKGRADRPRSAACIVDLLMS